MRWFVEQGNFAEDEACQQVLLKKLRLRIVSAGVETRIDMHLHGKNGSALCTCRPSLSTVTVSFSDLARWFR